MIKSFLSEKLRTNERIKGMKTSTSLGLKCKFSYWRRMDKPEYQIANIVLGEKSGK